MKKTLVLVLALSLLCMCACGRGNSPATPAQTAVPTAEAPENEPATLTGEVHAEITIRDYGTIKLTLDADEAPITVANFVKLARSGFYDGLTFHRIMDGFMIQGGDPTGTGSGGSDERIKGEFAANGVENSISTSRALFPWPGRTIPTAREASSSSLWRIPRSSTGCTPPSVM